MHIYLKASALHDLAPFTSENTYSISILQEKYRNYHLHLPQPLESENHTQLF